MRSSTLSGHGSLMSRAPTRSLTRALVRGAVALGTSLALAHTALAAASGAETIPAGGLIVKLKGTAGSSGREAAQAAEQRLRTVFASKSTAIGAVRATGTQAQLVRWSRALDAQESASLLAALRADPNVAYAVPNTYEHRLAVTEPDDPDFGDQWWLSASVGRGSRGVAGIFDAWSTSTGGTVDVAVLDTGLLVGQADLEDGARFATGYDLVTDDSADPAGDGDGRDSDFSDPGDGHASTTCSDGSSSASSWHGSKIAGIVGATTNNAVGVAGINRDVRVVTVRVAGPCGALVSDIVDGMRWAAGLTVEGLPLNPHPVRVINLSFGSANTDCSPYQDTINELADAGVLVIAAGGNEDGGVVNRPARCSGVLGVGAVQRNGAKTSYASVGAEIGITTTGGDFGVDGGIVTTSNDGTTAPGGAVYEGTYGTSFSTPIVTGVASLMLAVNPDLSRDQLIDGLKSTARAHVSTAGLPSCEAGTAQGACNCTTATCGAGLLDASAALAYAEARIPPDGGTGGGSEDDSGGGAAGGLGWGLALAASVLATRALRWRRR